MTRQRAVAVAAPKRSAIHSLVSGLKTILALALVLLLTLAVAAGVLTYIIVTARNDTESVTPSAYLLSSYTSLDFKDASGGEHEGWLLLGLRGAPAIILSPGYNSNRSELLSLGAALCETHYNVYLFNFSGPNTGERYSNLGTRQADDLLRAIDTVTKQPGVNPARVGLYGVGLGGYASLVASMRNPKVKALAVDTIYTTPDQMFEAQMDRLVGGSSALFLSIAQAEFHLLPFNRKPYAVQENLHTLQDVPKLFISGRDSPLLAQITEELYNTAAQPKKLLILDRSHSDLASGAEKEEYESQILGFFLRSLSLRAD